MSEQFYDTFKVPDDGYIPFEELFQRYSRELALKLACNAGNERCLSDAFNVNRHFIEDGHNIPKGLEGVVLCSGFRGTGKRTQWTKLYDLMKTTTDSSLKSQIIAALGCTDDADSLLDYLRSTVANGNNYTQSQRQNTFSATLNSKSGLTTVLSFINDYESDILSLFGYATLEDLLNVPARTIKNRGHQTIFVDFWSTLNNLVSVNTTRITSIINNNFALQQLAHYTTSIDFIRKYNLYQQTSTEPTQAPTPSPSGARTIRLQFAALFATIFIIFVCLSI